MFADKIRNRETGIIVYGITPPKKGTEQAKLESIATTQVERLSGLALDGLILYDIQDEAERTDIERPFPYMETLDAYDYSEQYLAELKIPKIIYRSAGKYTESELSEFLAANSAGANSTVFVGAASASTKSKALSLGQAYELKKNLDSSIEESARVLLGGVAIPERHISKGDEHIRMINKMEKGCSYFVSQGVYDVNASKNFLSEYYYYCKKNGVPMVPILFTLTPCGSVKTLEFMKWLGISIPKWFENELIHSEDILQKSVDYSYQSWCDLKAFADEKNIPIGCNIESVAIRKVEVEASIDLVKRITETLK